MSRSVRNKELPTNLSLSPLRAAARQAPVSRERNRSGVSAALLRAWRCWGGGRFALPRGLLPFFLVVLGVAGRGLAEAGAAPAVPAPNAPAVPEAAPSPDLGRFPSSFAEPPPGGRSSSTTNGPLVALLVPGVCGEVHLQAVLIAAARLGQVEAIAEQDLRVSPLESWRLESDSRHVLILARKEQLGGVDLPPSVATAVAALRAGEGLLAEVIRGPLGRRLWLVTGTDDSGLEKAALTLGSRLALRALGAGPAVIRQPPTLATEGEGGWPPIRVTGLQQLQEFLLVDPMARQAAVALPIGASLDQVSFLVALGFQLGRNLPAAPALWPLLVTYKPNTPIEPSRLQGRNVLLLGAVSQWGPVLPPGFAPLALLPLPSPVTAPGTVPVPEPEGTPPVLVQGRRHPRSDFDPGLAFAQLLPSPWSETNTVLCAGGWEGYTSPAVRRMLLDPSSPLVLAGNLGAMDEGGRGAAIELGDGGPSFVERVRQRVAPPVLEPGTKPVRTAAREPAAQRANRRLSAVCGAVLFFLVAARLSLMWQQSRARRAAFRRERRAGTAGGLL